MCADCVTLISSILNFFDGLEHEYAPFIWENRLSLTLKATWKLKNVESRLDTHRFDSLVLLYQNILTMLIKSPNALIQTMLSYYSQSHIYWDQNKPITLWLNIKYELNHYLPHDKNVFYHGGKEGSDCLSLMSSHNSNYHIWTLMLCS